MRLKREKERGKKSRNNFPQVIGNGECFEMRL